jgi:hypothetical protein
LTDYQIHEVDEEEDTNPYTLFVFAIRSPYTKESYFRRLRRFFEVIELCNGKTFEERCNIFALKGRADSKWAFNNILRFLQSQKIRAQKKEISAGTLQNYLKTIKFFCETTDISIPWKKITRGLPKGKRFADDRGPTLEEIKKIIGYPDRRIKSVVYTMASSGIRVGAWDYLKWHHIHPTLRRVLNNGIFVREKSIEQRREKHEVAVNPIGYFLKEAIAEDSVETDNIYKRHYIRPTSAFAQNTS